MPRGKVKSAWLSDMEPWMREQIGAGRSVASVARDLGVAPTTVHYRVDAWFRERAKAHCARTRARLRAEKKQKGEAT